MTRASAARIAFGRDGKVYMAIGIPLLAPEPGVATMTDAQNPGSLFGKVLRLDDDGSVPPDNPFVGRQGFRPEIYAKPLLSSSCAPALQLTPESVEFG